MMHTIAALISLRKKILRFIFLHSSDKNRLNADIII
jgi:hypothetical protein